MKDTLETIFIVIFLLIVLSPWFSLWNLSNISKISDSINKLTNEVKELRRAVENLKNNNS